MKREAKKDFVENIKNIVNENNLILVFHYRGLSMSEMSELSNSFAKVSRFPSPLEYR